MDELKNTLPGDIPELLRRGSPVLRLPGDQPEWTVTDGVNALGLVWLGRPGTFRATSEAHVCKLALDLTDATGRWHAALWATAHSNGRLTSDDLWVIQLARQTSNMTPEQIDELARLVLRLAERTP